MVTAMLSFVSIKLAVVSVETLRARQDVIYGTMLGQRTLCFRCTPVPRFRWLNRARRCSFRDSKTFSYMCLARFRFLPTTVRHLTPHELVLVGLSGYQTRSPRQVLFMRMAPLASEASPTDAKEKEKAKKKRLQELGIEVSVKKRVKTVQDHYDDCGDDITSLKLPADADTGEVYKPAGVNKPYPKVRADIFEPEHVPSIAGYPAVLSILPLF